MTVRRTHSTYYEFDTSRGCTATELLGNLAHVHSLARFSRIEQDKVGKLTWHFVRNEEDET